MTQIPLHAEQRRAHAKLYGNGGRGIVWHAVGQGKTRTGLAVIATLQEQHQWELPFIVVAVCRRKNFHTWEEEVEKLGLNYFVHRWNPDDTEHIYDDEKPTMWLVSIGQIERFWINPYVRHVIIDELHLFKNPKTIKAKASHKIAASRPVTGLSGSIVTARNIEDIYGQAWAVGIQKHISRTFTDFRSEYLISLPAEGNSPPIKTPKKGAYKAVMSKLEPFVDVYMPEKTDRRIHESVIKVPMSDAQRSVLNQLKETWELENIEFNNAISIMVKTQQISDGWVYLERGEKGDKDYKCWYSEVGTNKVDYLITLIEEILACEGNQVVVWCAFKHDVEFLAKRLPFATLQMTGDIPLDLAKWRSGNFPVVIATEASGTGHNDFEQVPYGIYYSQSNKWLDLQQSQGRHDRKASTHSDCYYYFLHTQGTLDWHIYNMVQQSKFTEKQIIEIGEIEQWIKQR